ncbi:MAG: hypothetical protein GY804_14080 [Alphaproteobacteria bacterium]|nr:hypothetical protein [Alphaproteobacteria bacterium]
MNLENADKTEQKLKNAEDCLKCLNNKKLPGKFSTFCKASVCGAGLAVASLWASYAGDGSIVDICMSSFACILAGTAALKSGVYTAQVDEAISYAELLQQRGNKEDEDDIDNLVGEIDKSKGIAYRSCFVALAGVAATIAPVIKEAENITPENILPLFLKMYVSCGITTTTFISAAAGGWAVCDIEERKFNKDAIKMQKEKVAGLVAMKDAYKKIL